MSIDEIIREEKAIVRYGVKTLKEYMAAQGRYMPKEHWKATTASILEFRLREFHGIEVIK